MKQLFITAIMTCCFVTLSTFAQDQPAAAPKQVPMPTAESLIAAARGFGTVVGKVTDSNNNPLEGASIGVVLNIPRPPKVGDAPQPRRPNLGNAKTLADGTFKIDHVPVGSYILHIHYNSTPGGAPAYDVKANQTTDLGTLTLKLRKPPTGETGAH